MRGRCVIEALAKRFPQLYVAPAEGAQEDHRLASGRGKVLESANLDHFLTSPDDELREVETPAGPVEVVFLKERKDFETFVQIIGHKSQPVPIDCTMGAVTYRGLADWGKVAAAHNAYLASGGDNWPAEFMRLAKDTDSFRSEIIVISEGPYSNIPASQTPYDDETWLHVSREIRLNHECAHVVCRRTMPDDILPVWDEVTADVVGLLFATNDYDARLAALFLGVSHGGYDGGRLAEYLSDEQKQRIDEIACEVYEACAATERLWHETDIADPFGFLLSLKENPLLAF